MEFLRVHACSVTQSRLTLCDQQTVIPLSVEFSRQEYWGGWLPFPPPGHLPNLGIEPTSLATLALADGFFTTTPPGKHYSSE